MTTENNDFKQKTSKKYNCEICDYVTCRKNNYSSHILSAKHIKNNKTTQNDNDFKQKISKKYSCKNCEKIFNDRAGLWRHNKKCTIEDEIENNDINVFTFDKNEIIKYLMKENGEFKTMMMEQQNMIMKVIENGTHNTTINTNNISNNNKAFNLNFFLNETCKDAMNIMDFVESIKLQLSDLERVGELGYVEGISNIIVKNLKELDISQRPVHCTDKKRETIYIKDDDKWEKDEEQKKMHKVIKKVADKNARLVLKYKELHPDCGTYHSKYSDQYNKIIIEAMGGSGDNDLEKEDKIIKNISKQIGIEKII